MRAWWGIRRISRRRMQLPACMRGLGLRSREHLAPAAFCACFVESAERFIDVRSHGTILPGFFPMLLPLFGAGAFDGSYPVAGRLSRYLSQQVSPPTAVAFAAAWRGMQAEVARMAGCGGCVLDATVGAAASRLRAARA